MKECLEESCTWKDVEQCKGCGIQGELNCRWNSGDLLVFFVLAFPGMLGALAGAIMIGMSQGSWWPLIGYILFFLIVMGIGEIRFLCSHCPYYAEKGKILHCLANHGALKIWRYHPEPMNRLEKALMVIFLWLYILLPMVILVYNIAYFYLNAYGNMVLVSIIGLTVVSGLSLVAFVVVLEKHICSVCVNFSCPFNHVDKAVVDAYLMKNPVMRKAWEEKGYQLGFTSPVDNTGNSL